MNCVLLALPKNFVNFNLSPVETMVYGYIHSFALNHCDNFSTQKRLASDLGYTVDAIKRARVKLKDKGLLLKATMEHRGAMITVWLPCMDLDLLIEILKEKIADADKINEILNHIKNKQNSFINQPLGQMITYGDNFGTNDPLSAPNDHPNQPNDHLNHVKRSPPECSELHLYNINEINLIYFLLFNNNNLLKDLLDLKDPSKPLTIDQMDFNFLNLFEISEQEIIQFGGKVHAIAEQINSKSCESCSFAYDDYNYYQQLPYIRKFKFEIDTKNFFSKITNQNNIAFDLVGTRLPHPLIFIAYVLPLACSKAGIDAVNTLIAGFKDAYELDFDDCVAQCLSALKQQ